MSESGMWGCMFVSEKTGMNICTACSRMHMVDTQANFHCLDEFDVFMDSINRGVRSRICFVCCPLLHALCSPCAVAPLPQQHGAEARVAAGVAQRALQMLMEFAVEQPDTQFILLTPLDLTAINHMASEVLPLGESLVASMCCTGPAAAGCFEGVLLRSPMSAP